MSAVTENREEVPVAGGTLTVATWGSPDAPPLLALHGVTSTHRDWLPAARVLAQEYRVIAPDLRGRGRSSDLDGPWGMTVHADDLVAIADHFGIAQPLLVGHSMGGFVAVLAAVRHPDRFPRLVLVDGGLPAVEANEGGDALTRIVLDAARARLEARFATQEDYLDSVAAMLPPGTEFDDDAREIARYDLVPASPGWRVSGTYDAIAADSAHITGPDAETTLAQLTSSALLLRAAHGLPPRAEGLYSAREVAEWTQRVPALRARAVPDVDHGSILRTPDGIGAIRDAIEEMMVHGS